MARGLAEPADAGSSAELGAQLLQSVRKEHHALRQQSALGLQEHLARIEQLFLQQSRRLDDALARHLKVQAQGATAVQAQGATAVQECWVDAAGPEPGPRRQRTASMNNELSNGPELVRIGSRPASRPGSVPPAEGGGGRPLPPDSVVPVLPGLGALERRVGGMRRRSNETANSSLSLSFAEAEEEEVSHLDTAERMDEHAAEWNRHLKDAVASQLARSRSKTFYVHSSASLESESRMYKVVSSVPFNAVCAVVIIINAVFTGLHAHWGMRNAMSTPPTAIPEWFRPVHLVILGLTIVEVCVRAAATGFQFLLGQDGKWNAFDLLVVLTSIVDEAVLDADLHAIRALRALRLIRVVRGIRLFRDLRLMVSCIVQSLTSFGWALMLLFVIMYIFSIGIMQAVASHLLAGGFSGETERAATLFYSTLFDTLMTLLQCITSGVDWQEAARPLGQISFVYRLLFAFYILFVVVCVLNVLTGLFVERAMELSGLDRDLVVQSRMNREIAFICAMKDIFEEADADGSGKISWEEFQDFLKKDEVRAYLATQQLDAYDARQLFNLLDYGDDDEVGIEEFILGLTRVKGTAKSVDVVATLQETRRMTRKLRSFMAEMQEQITTIAKAAGLPVAGLNASRTLRHGLTGDLSGRRPNKDHASKQSSSSALGEANGSLPLMPGVMPPTM